MPVNGESSQILFGSSETSPAFSSTNPDEPTELWIQTVGTPLDHVEVCIIHAHNGKERVMRFKYFFNWVRSNGVKLGRVRYILKIVCIHCL